MTAVDYLVDASAVFRLLRSGDPLERWRPQLEAGLVGTCHVVELEIFFSSQSAADRRRMRQRLADLLSWVPMPHRVFERAAEVQEALTARGQHRAAGPVDLLVAATAELHDLALVHYDHGFEVVAGVTGQPTRWVAPRGSVP